MILFSFLASTAYADPLPVETHTYTIWENFAALFPALVLETITITLLVRGQLRLSWLFALMWIVVTSVTWFGLAIGLMTFKQPSIVAMFSGELIVVGVEAFVLRMALLSARFVVNPTRASSWYACLGISFIGNAVSITAGYLIEVLLM
jgi:hypothetical protein